MYFIFMFFCANFHFYFYLNFINSIECDLKEVLKLTMEGTSHDNLPIFEDSLSFQVFFKNDYRF